MLHSPEQALKMADKHAFQAVGTDGTFLPDYDQYQDTGRYRFGLNFRFDDQHVTEEGSWIQILRPGRWNHPIYGIVEVNNQTFSDLKKHFEENVRGIDIAIDSEHKEDKGAAGWIKKLEVRPDGLWAFVEWTPKGQEWVDGKIYRYISAEFSPKYEDPETGKTTKNVLVAATVTNRPFIKRMAPIMLCEPGLKERLLSEDDLIEPDEITEQEFEGRGRKSNFIYKSFEDPVKSLKFKRKPRGGTCMKDRMLNEPAAGDYDSGISLDVEEFAEYVGEDSGITLVDANEGQEYDEPTEEGTVQYEEDYTEAEGSEVQAPSLKQYAAQRLEFSEVSAPPDPMTQRALVQLSERVAMQEAENAQLKQNLKLTAVEGELRSLVETDGIGVINAAQLDPAKYILMNGDKGVVNAFRRFMELSETRYDYREVGISGTQSMEMSEEDQLVDRANQIYAFAEKSGTPITMTQAYRNAWTEFHQA